MEWQDLGAFVPKPRGVRRRRRFENFLENWVMVNGASSSDGIKNAKCRTSPLLLTWPTNDVPPSRRQNTSILARHHVQGPHWQMMPEDTVS